MHKVMSPEQIAANKSNAQQSTGPRTLEGKARASRNSLTYGLLAESIVIRTRFSSEEQKDFDSLLMDFIGDHQPVGVTEQTLVERMAVAYWRLRRVQQFESGMIAEALEAQATADSANHSPAQRSSDATSNLEPATTDVCVNSAAADSVELRRLRNEWINSVPGKKPLRKIVRYETMLERKFNKALADLYNLRQRKAMIEATLAKEEQSAQKARYENFQTNPSSIENTIRKLTSNWFNKSQ